MQGNASHLVGVLRVVYVLAGPFTAPLKTYRSPAVPASSVSVPQALRFWKDREASSPKVCLQIPRDPVGSGNYLFQQRAQSSSQFSRSLFSRFLQSMLSPPREPPFRCLGTSPQPVRSSPDRNLEHSSDIPNPLMSSSGVVFSASSTPTT